jgi:hypothetical protein
MHKQSMMSMGYMMNVMTNVLNLITLEKTKQILFEIFMSDDAIINT